MPLIVQTYRSIINPPHYARSIHCLTLTETLILITLVELMKPN